MALDLSKYLFIDNHAHSILARSLELDKFGFRRCFSESRSREQISEHVGESIAYMDLIHKIGRFLGTDDEDGFIVRRTGRLLSEYVRALWDDMSIAALIIDEGFTQPEMFSAARLAEVSQRRIYSCTRIETMLEDCIRHSDSFDSLAALLPQRLFAERYPPTVALKTIMAYRGGLQLMPVSPAEAADDFHRVKARFNAGSQRIERCPLYHYFLLQSFELAARHNLPVQIHTGLGDDDEDILNANPALLQPLFKLPTLNKTTFVMLHCYPYVREAALLTSLYPNVYMDLSLSLNLVSPFGEQLVAEALACAPATKLIAGTDGHSSPESHWYGALCWKRSLARSLDVMISKGFLTKSQAENVGAFILHENARRIYRLEGMP